MENEVLIYATKKPKLILQAVIMGVGMALSLWVMSNVTIIMHRDLRWAVFIAGTIGCLAFGYGLFYNFLRIWKSEPLLKADVEGLWFHGSQTYYGKILWSDIAGYEVAQYGLSKKVLIKLKDPIAFSIKYQDLRKLVFGRVLKRYGTPVALPFSYFERDVLEMLHEIAAYAKRLEAAGLAD
jgi:hypothetical protein